VHRDDRHGSTAGEVLEPALVWQQQSRASDLSFGEDADQLTLIEVAASIAKCSPDHSGTAGRRDGNGPERFHEGSEERMVEVVGVHNEANRPVEAREDKQTIDQGNVVRNEQRPTLAGDMLSFDDLKSIAGADQGN
jgi:hypothetical protein